MTGTSEVIPVADKSCELNRSMQHPPISPFTVTKTSGLGEAYRRCRRGTELKIGILLIADEFHAALRDVAAVIFFREIEQ